MMDEGIQRLRAVYEAARHSRGREGPWREMPREYWRCGDCPFSRSGLCLVDLGPCWENASPCGYFDPPDYPMVRRLIEEGFYRAGWQQWEGKSSGAACPTEKEEPIASYGDESTTLRTS